MISQYVLAPQDALDEYFGFLSEYEGQSTREDAPNATVNYRAIDWSPMRAGGLRDGSGGNSFSKNTLIFFFLLQSFFRYITYIYIIIYNLILEGHFKLLFLPTSVI